jgi:hypothetical protein
LQSAGYEGGGHPVLLKNWNSRFYSEFFISQLTIVVDTCADSSFNTEYTRIIWVCGLLEEVIGQTMHISRFIRYDWHASNPGCKEMVAVAWASFTRIA